MKMANIFSSQFQQPDVNLIRLYYAIYTAATVQTGSSTRLLRHGGVSYIRYELIKNLWVSSGSGQIFCLLLNSFVSSDVMKLRRQRCRDNKRGERQQSCHSYQSQLELHYQYEELVIMKTFGEIN